MGKYRRTCPACWCQELIYFKNGDIQCRNCGYRGSGWRFTPEIFYQTLKCYMERGTDPAKELCNTPIRRGRGRPRRILSEVDIKIITDPTLSLRQAADQLGMSYVTVMRHRKTLGGAR